MNWRRNLYYWIRKKFTYKEWEDYYKEICSEKDKLVTPYLKSLLDHARDHVPYYSKILKNGGSGVDPLKEVPILRKDTIRQNFEQLKCDDIEERRWCLNSSGGSTGKPITLAQDWEYIQWGVASETFFFKELIGEDYTCAKKVVLWGSESDLFGLTDFRGKISNWLTHTFFLNSFKMTPENMREYVEVLNGIKPVFIKGYSGSLHQLAKFIKKNNLPVHRPRFIYSAAEALRPFMRDAIEEVFGCKVHDFYGSREVGAMAGECKKGKMHIFNFNNLVEVVDQNNQAVEPGGEGKLLITNLHNKSMPLIRYEIGDMAVLGTNCGCSLPLPTLEKITGRITDHFTTRNGTLVHGEYFTHLFYFLDWVEEFEVLQKDYNQVQISYVSKEDAREGDVEDINRKIKLVMGDDCQIEWNPVEEIPKTPQGKYLFTRSLVPGH